MLALSFTPSRIVIGTSFCIKPFGYWSGPASKLFGERSLAWATDGVAKRSAAAAPTIPVEILTEPHRETGAPVSQNAAAMPPELDPDAQAILDVMAASGEPRLPTLSVEEARERVRAALVARGRPLPLQSVDDLPLPT